MYCHVTYKKKGGGGGEGGGGKVGRREGGGEGVRSKFAMSFTRLISG